MKIEKINITPDLAEKMLNNRESQSTALSEQKIDRYSELIQSEQWKPEGGVITLSSRDKSFPNNPRDVFSGEDYTIFDGHHRLSSIIKSKKTLEMHTAFVEEEDWDAVQELSNPTGILNAIVLLMSMSGETEVNLNEFFEENPAFLEIYYFCRKEYEFERTYPVHERPAHLILFGKIWVVTTLLFIFCRGEFDITDQNSIIANEYMKILIRSKDVISDCEKTQTPSAELIESREIIENNPFADRVDKLKKIVDLFEDWRKVCLAEMQELGLEA